MKINVQRPKQSHEQKKVVPHLGPEDCTPMMGRYVHTLYTTLVDPSSLKSMIRMLAWHGRRYERTRHILFYTFLPLEGMPPGHTRFDGCNRQYCSTRFPPERRAFNRFDKFSTRRHAFNPSDKVST